MSIDFTWLEENFFDKKLNDHEREIVRSKIDIIAYKSGDAIVEQGSVGHAIYIVNSGAANIDSNCNGENIRLATVHAGDLVGEMSFLTSAEASATVTARDDCTIYKLTRHAFTNLMKEDSELAILVIAHLLKHTANVIRHMNSEKASVQHYMAGSRF